MFVIVQKVEEVRKDVEPATTEGGIADGGILRKARGPVEERPEPDRPTGCQWSSQKTPRRGTPAFSRALRVDSRRQTQRTAQKERLCSLHSQIQRPRGLEQNEVYLSVNCTWGHTLEDPHVGGEDGAAETIETARVGKRYFRAFVYTPVPERVLETEGGTGKTWRVASSHQRTGGRRLRRRWSLPLSQHPRVDLSSRF